MIEKKKKYLKIALILLVLSIVYTVVVKFVNVEAIGPGNTKVGLSCVNGWFHDTIGYNSMFYKISKYAGILPFLFVGYYGLLGLIELIKNKSFSKVNKKLYILACFYVIFAALYFIFEKVALNYRPVVIKGVIEASYPSTHTLLAICICGSSLVVSKYLVKNETLRKLFDIFAWILMVTIVVTRLISGVHWLTDIIGGILISLTYIYFLKLSITRMDEKELTIE